MAIVLYYSVFYKLFNYHSIFSEGYVRRKRRSFFGIILIVLLVFVPCFFKSHSCFASEAVFEMPHGNLMGHILPCKNIHDGLFSLVDMQKGVVKGMSKFFSGSIERNDPMDLTFPGLGKEMVCNSSNENPKKNVQTFFDHDGNLHLFMDPFLWIGFSLCILYWVLYVFIQILEAFLRYLQDIYDCIYDLWR